MNLPNQPLLQAQSQPLNHGMELKYPFYYRNAKNLQEVQLIALRLHEQHWKLRETIQAQKVQMEEDPTDEELVQKYSDSQFLLEILERQIGFRKNQETFWNLNPQMIKQGNENVLEIDFSSLIDSKGKVLFKGALGSLNTCVQSILLTHNLQHSYCIQEIRAFFYSILSKLKAKHNLNRTAKSAQPISACFSENTLKSPIIQLSSTNRLVSIGKEIDRSKFEFQYMFMGLRHSKVVPDLSNTVVDFLGEIFGKQCNLYHLLELNNFDPTDTKVVSEDTPLDLLLKNQQNYTYFILKKEKNDKEDIPSSAQDLQQIEEEADQENPNKSTSSIPSKKDMKDNNEEYIQQIEGNSGKDQVKKASLPLGVNFELNEMSDSDSDEQEVENQIAISIEPKNKIDSQDDRGLSEDQLDGRQQEENSSIEQQQKLKLVSESVEDANVIDLHLSDDEEEEGNKQTQLQDQEERLILQGQESVEFLTEKEEVVEEIHFSEGQTKE